MCDFLVLSVMSLAIGTGNPADVGRPTHKISKIEQIEIVRKELDKRAELLQEKKIVDAELVKLENLLATAQKQTQASELSAEENAKRLAQLRDSLQAREKDLQAKSVALSKTQIERAQLSEKLTESARKAAVLSDELTKSQSELTESARKEAALKEALAKSSEQKATLLSELKTTNVRVRETELGLSYTRGHLSSTEKELAEAKGKIEKAAQALFAREVELREAQLRLENMKNLLSSAVTELSSTKSELKGTKLELGSSVTDLKSAQKYLADTETKLKVTEGKLEIVKEQIGKAVTTRDESLAKYSEAVLELSISLENERFINNAEFNSKLYLPEIILNGKNYLPVDFRSATGIGSMHSGYSKVIKLDYRQKRPSAVAQSQPKALLSMNADNRVCLLESANQAAKPLSVLTYEKLKKRGLQDLYLFKAQSLGKSVTGLDGRCSISLQGENHYLYIRNQRGDPALSAENGDFIISKEGEFVGLVLAERSYDLGTRHEAQCWLFPEKSNLNDITPLPLNKTPADDYFVGFVDASKILIKRVNELDAKYRSGNP